MNRQQQRSNFSGFRSKQTCAQQIDGWDRGNPGHYRKTAYDKLAATESDPATQKRVIEDHIGLAVDDRAHENVPLHLCQYCTGRFVEPETFCSQTEKSESGGEGNNESPPETGIQRSQGSGWFDQSTRPAH